MIKSMTGYGKGRTAVGDIALTVEVKSVNHRYGDVSVKLPRFLLGLEGEIKKRVSARLKRGKIDVFINVEGASSSILRPVVNRDLADAYLELFRRMRADYELNDEITLDLLVRQKEVVTLAESAPDEDALGSCLDGSLDSALDALERMRMAEGAATQRDMQERLDNLAKLLAEARVRAPLVPREWQGKLTERLARLEKGFEVDPQRVAQEVAVFADRCDVSEELTRFQSHLEQFRDLFESEDPVGRQLDFIVQEINREANTMGSKSNDLELTRLVVAMKAELEKIREQVQNIE
jgi:uncharacterized protein (TIGR00255 family)